MAEIKNEIVTNVIARCENADEVTGAIGALVTAGVVSMNDVIKTMYNQYAEEVSSRNDEYEELVGENIELTLKIAELENKLDEIRVEMIWNDDISFEGFTKKINAWYEGKESELCDPPIDAQFALDLIFKTLVDDKDNYSYLTTIPESTEQINFIMLDLILFKYSKKYRKYLKQIKKGSK